MLKQVTLDIGYNVNLDMKKMSYWAFASDAQSMNQQKDLDLLL